MAQEILPGTLQTVGAESPGSFEIPRRHFAQASWIARDLNDLLHEGFVISAWENVFAREQFGYASNIRADARTAARHRFDQRPRQAFRA